MCRSSMCPVNECETCDNAMRMANAVTVDTPWYHRYWPERGGDGGQGAPTRGQQLALSETVRRYRTNVVSAVLSGAVGLWFYGAREGSSRLAKLGSINAKISWSRVRPAAIALTGVSFAVHAWQARECHKTAAAVDWRMRSAGW
jgi:hypothetical protein